MKQGTQSQCSRTTWMDAVGRAEGGGSGWEDTRAPVADSCRCMAKTTTLLYTNYPPIKIN